MARRAMAVSTAVAALAVTGCSSTTTTAASGSTDPTRISVESTDTVCTVGATELPAGTYTFVVHNGGSQVTEFYLYEADGSTIVSELENVGPALSRELIVNLKPGSYETACKPGMVGDGIRGSLTITGTAATATSSDTALTAAVQTYREYVEGETAALVSTTTAFADAVIAGDIDLAKSLYSPARVHFERIEPIAETFGDLDPLIDMRIDDAVDGTPFTGFHALEQALWETGSLAGTEQLAIDLKANTVLLAELIPTVEITPLTMANGAKALLDEVAMSKVTGEEERYSRVDLVDFAGNVEGAEAAIGALMPTITTRNPELAADLTARFTALTALLDGYQVTEGQPGYVPGSPYVSYDVLTEAQVKGLATAVDTLSESLGKVPAVVL